MVDFGTGCRNTLNLWGRWGVLGYRMRTDAVQNLYVQNVGFGGSTERSAPIVNVA